MKMCPCCGHRSLSNDSEYDICEICFWQDDPEQAEDPDLEGGSNGVSLRQAQKNYMEFGACDEHNLMLTKRVKKRVKKSFKKSMQWKALENNT